MIIGLHGDSTADVPRPVVEVHSIEQELAITQHPPVVANIVLDHLSKQTRAIPKGVLVIKLYFTLFVLHCSFISVFCSGSRFCTCPF